MADLIRLAYYPFLPGVREAIQESGPDIGDLLSGALYADVRRRATGRVLRSLSDDIIETPAVAGDSAALNELLAQAVTRMLIVALGDRIVASRYATKEAARVRRALRTDQEDMLDEAAEALGVPVTGRLAAPEDGPVTIHFADALHHAPRRDEWKLVLRTIDAGSIKLGRRDVEELIEEAWRRRVEAGLHREMEHPPGDLRKALQRYLDEIGPELASAKENWNTGDFGPVRDTAFPPCISQLFSDMKAGAMIPHHGRFAFASFLGTVGMSADQILDYMTQIPNFSRDKSEYQIRHIAGEYGADKYTPPGCATMQTNGVCPLEKRDDICFSIKHPLSYYRKKLYRLPKQIVDATKQDAADKGPAEPEATQ